MIAVLTTFLFLQSLCVRLITSAKARAKTVFGHLNSFSQQYLSVACSHFSLSAGFVIAIVVEFIQQFFLLEKLYPFSLSANLAAHSLSKVFLPSLALLKPMKTGKIGFSSKTLYVLIKACESVMCQLSVLLMSCTPILNLLWKNLSILNFCK